MIVGVPKEIKTHEYRVGLTPTSVREIAAHGHQVLVETNAGVGIGAADAVYEKAGARIVGDVFDAAELIVKVKEPLAAERATLRPGQVLFTYLHLAADPLQCRELVAGGAVGIAYETVRDDHGGLPLLAPMSEVAGRMAVQVGARFLERPQGGRGMLLGGVPGVAPATVVILGAGVAGGSAARAAVGAGAHVVVLNRGIEALRGLARELGARITTLPANPDVIEAQVCAADLLVGAVLVPGAAAPRLVSRDLVRRMKPGAVIVDIAIDQGGCVETSRPTTHDDPVFVVDGVLHYGVANMPGAVPLTSTQALNNATLPHVLALADKGWRRALREDAGLRAGLNVAEGRIACRAVAEALGEAWVPPESLLGP